MKAAFIPLQMTTTNKQLKCTKILHTDEEMIQIIRRKNNLRHVINNYILSDKIKEMLEEDELDGRHCFRNSVEERYIDSREIIQRQLDLLLYIVKDNV